MQQKIVDLEKILLESKSKKVSPDSELNNNPVKESVPKEIETNFNISN